VFLVNVPVGAAALALALRAVPRAAATGTRRGLDPAAQVLGLAGLAALTLALIKAGSLGWTHPLVLAGFAVAALAAVGFVLVERGSADAMLPLDLFRSPTFSAASVAGMAINLGFYGQLFVVNLYLQQVRGLSPLVAGLALLPELGVVSAASVLSGRVSGRAGVRPTMLVGLAVGAAGLAGLVLAGADTPYPVLVAPLVATGFGMAFTMPAVTTAVVEAAPGERAGIASGVINASRQVGGVVGVALLGTLVARPGAFLAGMHAGVLVAATAFLSAWMVALLAVQRGDGHARERVAA
jgi:DHA2 family methylenomycin A resistance protein-like MFS transporter